MVYKWYDDHEEMSSFMRAVENKIKKDDIGFDVTLIDWHWREWHDKKNKHSCKILFFSGNITGVSWYSCNQRDVDDFDTVEFDVDLDVDFGGYDEKDILNVSKQEFFKRVVDDICHEVHLDVEVYADSLAEDDDNWGNADNWRD